MTFIRSTSALAAPVLEDPLDSLYGALTPFTVIASDDDDEDEDEDEDDDDDDDDDDDEDEVEDV